MTHQALSFHEVSKHFPLQNKRFFTALQTISFTAEAGEKIAIVGASGSGKSTLIRLLTGILSPTSGEIKIFGVSPNKERHFLSHKIGVLWGQRSQLWYHLPPIDSFVLLGALYGIAPHTCKKRIQELSTIFAIEPLLHKNASSLSLEERMLCEILASLIHKPIILVLDDPLLNLSSQTQEKIKTSLAILSTNEKLTLCFSSSDKKSISSLCTRILVLEKGVLHV